MRHVGLVIGVAAVALLAGCALPGAPAASGAAAFRGRTITIPDDGAYACAQRGERYVALATTTALPDPGRVEGADAIVVVMAAPDAPRAESVRITTAAGPMLTVARGRGSAAVARDGRTLTITGSGLVSDARNIHNPLAPTTTPFEATITCP